MRLTVCAVLGLASLSFAQQTGPFGLTAGMNRKQVEQIVGANAVTSQKGDDIIYSTAPKPHPLFEQYMLTFSRKYGLVAVEGIASIPDNRLGSSTRSKCEDLLSTLSNKYGKPHQSDGCEFKAKQACANPKEYSMWDVPSPRSDKVGAISLMVLLMPTTKNERGESVVAGCNDPHAQWDGQIMLFYLFDDYNKYQDEVKSTL